MAYLGNQPSNNFVSLKRQVITGNGGSSYTLDHSVASVNDVAIFVNNVRQDPASYSISGTALTLGGTISSSDSCYVIFLGQALQTVTPDADTITTAMLKSNSVTSAKMFSGFANGITVADQFRLSADVTASTNPITSNIERVDTAGQGGITGSQMSESSGIFTFPSTGIYLVSYCSMVTGDSDGDNIGIGINVTTDNSSYTEVARGFDRPAASGHGNCFCESLIDVTDTSNVKVSFSALSLDSGSKLGGDSAKNETSMTFIRMGDT